MERNITFHIIFNDEKFNIELKEYDTVGHLKDFIFRKIGIFKSKQVITGWRQSPNDDHDILQKCADIGIANILHVQERNMSFKNTLFNNDLELKACYNFIHEVLNNVPDILQLFSQIGCLKTKICELYMAPTEKRKVLLLYLHNKLDPFSMIFWRNMKESNVKKILTESFSVIGWDLGDKTLHNALIDALKNNELDHIVSYINNSMGAAICLITDDDQKGVKIFSSMTKSISDTDFFNCLENASKIGYERNVINSVVQQNFADSLGVDYDSYEENASKSGYERNVINSVVVQQHFADSLGNRDYDSYKEKQHEFLKNKIGYAIAGPPTQEDGYSEGVKKEIEKLYMKIITKSNEVAEYMNEVELAIIYNCTEPLPNVKEDRKKKEPKYNPDEDIMTFPVFIIRKCRGSINPCRIFIDHIGRVYSTWKEYLTENKLHECVMVVPKNGRYKVDEDERVILDRDYSPACSKATKVLNGLDIAGAVGGVASSGVGVATAVLSGTAIAASPVLAVGAMATGAVVGVYSIFRSSMTIRDRRLREESMNIFECSEARGACMNIVAGSLGFVGAGTNVMFSKLVSNGVTIGTGAKAAVNAINAINLGAGGASIVNSVHDVVSQWVISKERPSALILLQLSSNILFFGHAVVNFKTAGTMIDETQAKLLKDYKDNLRSNRHRKTFNRVLKETVRKNDGNSVQAKTEVIAALRHIKNKDETFAALTRNLSKLSKKGIRVFFENGQIKFNDVAIDMVDFCTIKGNEVNSFLTYLPVSNVVNTADVTIVHNLFSKNNIIVPYQLVAYATQLIVHYKGDVKEMIISTVAKLLHRVTDPYIKLLKEIWPNDYHMKVFNMVLNFFSKRAQEYEKKYQKWKTTNSYEDYLPIFDYVDFDKIKRCIKFMEEAVRFCFEFKHMKPEVYKRLINKCYQYIVSKYNDYQENKYNDYQENKEREEKRQTSKSVKTDCKVCGGHYFKSQI